MKPLLEHFEETNQKIDNNGEAMQIKNERINKLKEEVSQLQVDISSCLSNDHIIKLYKDKEKSSEDLITSMKQTIFKLTEKQVSNTCTSNCFQTANNF